MASELTREMLARLRQALERRGAELRADVELHLQQSDAGNYAGLGGQVGDIEDRALADLLVDDNLGMVHRDVQELRDIQDALGRMAQGTYGECIDCGSAIDPERLEAYPEASRCHDCQEVHERTYGRPTDRPPL